ncbi:hypothetical protein PTKIN_Ptkin15bG0114200 [Pterospermum kingtungense]
MGKNQFLSHKWILRIILRFRFLRIFALSCAKEGKVNDFGHYVNNSWTWHISLRRRLFCWELSQWNDLMAMLDEFYVCNSLEDNLVWKAQSSGVYSAKSFYASMTAIQGSPCEVWFKV